MVRRGGVWQGKDMRLNYRRYHATIVEDHTDEEERWVVLDVELTFRCFWLLWLYEAKHTRQVVCPVEGDGNIINNKLYWRDSGQPITSYVDGSLVFYECLAAINRVKYTDEAIGKTPPKEKKFI